MKKLSLNKEIISNITNGEMSQLKGGILDEEQVELFNSHVLCHTGETGASCFICWSDTCTYGPK